MGYGRLDAARLYAEAEVRAERTIAIVRMVVSALLGTAFFFAVLRITNISGDVVDRQFAIAAASIAAYFALGIVSFAAARPSRYRSWMSWLFVTLDAAFIVLSITFGILNAGAPVNYAAAFPAIWLIPLVLAFGTLRYNAYLQAYAAIALIGGVVGAAYLAGPWVNVLEAAAPKDINLFFALPPNLMRIVMITVAAMVLVIAVLRARLLLGRTVAEMQRRATVTRYLPPQIADWLGRTTADAARRGRRQPAAVLFADIRGFTQLAETIDPVDLGYFVADFRRCVAEAAKATGGVIDKFIGDAAMIVFGVPENRDGDAARALECGQTILRQVGRWNRARAASGQDDVEIGIGAHWGEVFCGAVGDDHRLEFAVLGDTVNVAARIEKLTKAAGLPMIVSQDLLDAAGVEPTAGAMASDWVVLEPQRLRGRAEEIRLYGYAPDEVPAVVVPQGS